MFVKIKSVGEEGCTAVLFGSVLVMAVHAPDCCKDLEVHETFVKEKPKCHGKDAGAKRFHIAGDLGLLCTSHDDVEELNRCPIAGKDVTIDQGRFKKLMWYELFNCKAILFVTT